MRCAVAGAERVGLQLQKANNQSHAMVTIFISYSHADEELRRQLDVHLAALRRQGVVDIWHDRKIRAGEEFANEIDGALSTANIILLLVSADFIN